ncbi:MAG: transposase [bacterium]|nr:transposase [bacterium]
MPQPLPPRRKIIWPDAMHYFLTNSTYLHYPYFKEDSQRQIILNYIKELKLEYAIPIQAFSIAINHHHLMFYADKGKKVSFVKSFLKGNIGREYKKNYKISYPTIWHSTRVLWIKDEKMLRAIQGYVNGNLLKHKQVSNFQELYDNPFSSFKYYADKYGFIYAKNMVMDVIQIDEDAQGGIDMKGLTAGKPA